MVVILGLCEAALLGPKNRLSFSPHRGFTRKLIHRNKRAILRSLVELGGKDLPVGSDLALLCAILPEVPEVIDIETVLCSEVLPGVSLSVGDVQLVVEVEGLLVGGDLGVALLAEHARYMNTVAIK